MYQTKFQRYLQSDNYHFIESDEMYCRLIILLRDNLPTDTFLEAEELLNDEILFKIEEGFKHGYQFHK